jgi:hypothetical protein
MTTSESLPLVVGYVSEQGLASASIFCPPLAGEMP